MSIHGEIWAKLNHNFLTSMPKISVLFPKKILMWFCVSFGSLFWYFVTSSKFFVCFLCYETIHIRNTCHFTLNVTNI